MTDHELDAALGQLGLPEGAEPRGDAGAILARARLLAGPPPTPIPWRVPALLAAALLLGVGIGRASAPTATAGHLDAAAPLIVPVPVVLHDRATEAPLAALAPSPAKAASGKRPKGASRASHAASGSPHALTAAAAPASAAAPSLASVVPPAAAPDLHCPVADSATAPDPTLAELLADDPPSPHVPDTALAVDALPHDGDRRLVRPDRVPRDPDELREVQAAETTKPDAHPAPLDLRLVAGGGSDRGAPGGSLGLGIGWRPALAGFARPEATFDVEGVGRFRLEGANWDIKTTAATGLVLGSGAVRAAVDWSVSARINLEDPPGPTDEELPPPFATGPSLAAEFGPDSRIRARVGARLDLAPHAATGPTTGWDVRPGAFVAVELPLDRAPVD